MNTVICNNQPITPSKVVCIGRNYVAHAKELGNAVPTEPVIFIKPNSAISDTLSSGVDETNHYEGEICFMVVGGKLSAVGFGLDLTKRVTQSKLKESGLPWERAKAFNGAAVFSEFVSIEEGDIELLALELEIDGECKQSGNINLMLFKPHEILKEINTFVTMEDGDIIMTGTPEGVGEVRAGSHFTGRILLKNEVLITSEWIAK